MITYSDLLEWTAGLPFAQELASRFYWLKINVNKALRNEEAWVVDKDYYKNDFTYYNNAYWHALAPSNGVEPGTNPAKWRQLGGTSGGSPLSVTDASGDTQNNVALLNFPHLTLVNGELVNYEFFEDGDAIPNDTAVAVVEAPPAGPALIQVTVGANYTMNGSEDRTDADTTAGAVMITLPVNPSLYHEKARFTITNIGPNPANMAHVQPSAGDSFALGSTPIDLGPGDALEVYASKRLNNTYIWSTI